MSEYRDQLPGEQRKIYDAAIDAAAQVLADAVAERELLAATCGTRAVAEAAWYPGHPLKTVDAIQARYEEMRARQYQPPKPHATRR